MIPLRQQPEDRDPFLGGTELEQHGTITIVTYQQFWNHSQSSRPHLWDGSQKRVTYGLVSLTLCGRSIDLDTASTRPYRVGARTCKQCQRILEARQRKEQNHATTTTSQR